MTDEIAKMVVAVDSTSAKAAVSDLDKLAEAGGRAEQATKRVTDATQNETRAVTSGSEALKRHNQVVQEWHDREKDRAFTLARQAQLQAAATAAMEKGTKAAKSTSDAHKGLSLTSGQVVREYAVLVNELQRGDFTRFQGSLITLGNRMGATTLLFTAMGAAIAAGALVVGGLAVATALGAHELSTYNKAVQATGDYAHTSFEEMEQLSHSISNNVTTVGQSKEALTAVIGTGRFFRSEIALISQGVLDMSRITGKSVEETVQAFIKLKDDPLRAVEELDKTYHFLTQSVYDQIRALTEQNDKAGAVALAEKALAEAFGARAQSVSDNIGYLQSRWNDLRVYASNAWDAMLGVGRKDSIQEQIDTAIGDLRAKQASLRLADPNDRRAGKDVTKDFLFGDITLNMGGNSQHRATVAVNEQVAAVNKLIKLRDGDKSARDAAARESEFAQRTREATKAIEDRGLAYNRAAQREREINKIRMDFENARRTMPNDPRFSASAEAQQVRDAEIRYKERRERKPAKTDEERAAAAALREQAAEYERVTKQIAQYNGVLDESAEQGSKLTDIQRYAARVLETLGTSHSKLNAAQQKTVRGELEELLGKDKLNQARLTANKILEASTSIQERFAQAASARAKDASRELAAIGRGGDMNDLQARFDDITDRAAQDRIELTEKARRANALMTEEYLNGIEAINRAEAEQLENEKRYFDDRKAAQADWRNGARRALEDIGSEADDVAGQTYTGFRNAFSAMESAVDAWAKGTKASFKDVAKTILAELLKIELRILLSKALNAIFGAGAAGASGGASSGQPGGGATVVAGRGIAVEGGLRVMARGGVTHGAELLPMARGRGLIGEQGPEGVLPLKRTSNGELGVISQGGGAASNNIGININVANDGKSDTSTSSDENSKQAKMMSLALGKKIKDTLVEEMKPGGIIWGYNNGR